LCQDRGIRGKHSILALAITFVLAHGTSAHAGKSATADDFVSDARALMRLTACAGDAKLPATITARRAQRHCKRLARAIKRYRARWMSKATPFFAKLVPASIPKRVIYPFGGGDLLTALVVFPGLSEITTISLEPAGDVTAPARMSRRHLSRALASLGAEMEWLLIKNYGRTRRMRVVMTQARLPGQLAFSLLALAVHGYEPLSVRYFDLTSSGAVHYLDRSAIAAAGKRGHANVEIRFRAAGKANAPVRVFRHLQQNLDDNGLRTTSGKRVLAHLRAKGSVTAMTKAASYLLWWRRFSTIRGYLTKHMEWMISDSTGLLPRHARRAGFSQEVWGSFTECIIRIADFLENEAARMWKSHRYRRMPFRFGYPDKKGHNHLMVTRRRRSKRARK
jgi:hypothetical protein